tara:strand:- start:9 stop:551 length:543 start_codon:yes stop_codon:yes gene_type:complete
MDRKTYLKGTQKYLQSGTFKTEQKELKPNQKKIQIQFLKKQIKKSYNKEEFELFEVPDFELNYYENDLDQIKGWYLTDHDDSFSDEDVYDEDFEPRYIYPDEDIDTPGHRACNFLEKCMKVKSLRKTYDKFLVIEKNAERYQGGKTICYSLLCIDYLVDLVQFQKDLKKSGFKVNFHYGI